MDLPNVDLSAVDYLKANNGWIKVSKESYRNQNYLLRDTLKDLGTLFMGDYMIRSPEVKKSLLSVLNVLKTSHEKMFNFTSLQGQILEKIEILEALCEVSGNSTFSANFKSPFIDITQLENESFKKFFNVTDVLYREGYKFELEEFKLCEFVFTGHLDQAESAQFSFVCVPGYFAVVAGEEKERLKFHKGEITFFKNKDLKIVLDSFYRG